MNRYATSILALLLSLLCFCEAAHAHRFDAESGLNYCKNRYYASGLARFLSRDKIRSRNLYQYVISNPLNYLDSIGLWEVKPFKAPPGENTIVCDGNGGVTVQVGTTTNDERRKKMHFSSIAV